MNILEGRRMGFCWVDNIESVAISTWHFWMARSALFSMHFLGQGAHTHTHCVLLQCIRNACHAPSNLARISNFENAFAFENLEFFKESTEFRIFFFEKDLKRHSSVASTDCWPSFYLSLVQPLTVSMLALGLLGQWLNRFHMQVASCKLQALMNQMGGKRRPLRIHRSIFAKKPMTGKLAKQLSGLRTSRKGGPKLAQRALTGIARRLVPTCLQLCPRDGRNWPSRACSIRLQFHSPQNQNCPPAQLAALASAWKEVRATTNWWGDINLAAFESNAIAAE